MKVLHKVHRMLVTTLADHHLCGAAIGEDHLKEAGIKSGILPILSFSIFLNHFVLDVHPLQTAQS